LYPPPRLPDHAEELLAAKGTPRRSLDDLTADTFGSDDCPERVDHLADRICAGVDGLVEFGADELHVVLQPRPGGERFVFRGDEQRQRLGESFQ